MRGQILVLGVASLISCMSGQMSQAAVVKVTVTGPVDFCVIQGGLTNVPDGAPVSMSFNVDSNNFVNSPNFPTRGYGIDLSSFALDVGGVNVPVVVPTPSGQPAYFVLRDNDPAVDGFFISDGNVDFPFPLAVTIPGLAPVHELDFSVGYSNGNQISSLNILDAVGTYDLSSIGSYLWTIGRFGNPGAEFAYQQITISVVPEPTSAVLSISALLVGGTMMRRCKTQ